MHLHSQSTSADCVNRKSGIDSYQTVRKWTSKVDIFAKKFIFVPINEQYVERESRGLLTVSDHLPLAFTGILQSSSIRAASCVQHPQHLPSPSWQSDLLARHRKTSPHRRPARGRKRSPRLASLALAQTLPETSAEIQTEKSTAMTISVKRRSSS